MLASSCVIALWIGAAIVVFWLCTSTSSPLLKLYVYLRVKSDMRLWRAKHRHSIANGEENEDA